MGRLKINAVSYSGDRYEFTSPRFPDGLSIIEGPNGTGKTTFFNLIYFGLGGKVEEFDRTSRHAHREITGDTSNFVRLDISINGVPYIVSRRIGDNSIAVGSVVDLLENDESTMENLVLPVFRQGGERTFSDWILESLGIAVVDIFQGGRRFKLNFTDLARLIYHNQSPDPHGIFKPADSSNFIADSLEVRRAVFQVLVGKTLLALYEAIGTLKAAEKDKEAARAIVTEYKQIVTELLAANGIKEVTNRTHLVARIQELTDQLEKLGIERAKRVSSGTDGEQFFSSAEIARKDYEALSVERVSLDERLSALFREKTRLDDVKTGLVEDIRRIKKILYTHEQLNLFSADTCPYCLNTVDRPKDRCVCGCVVDEKNYQRFFYSASEYIEILKSKVKSLETLRSAAEAVYGDITALAMKRDDLLAMMEESRVRFQRAGDQATPARDQQVELIEEKMFEIRNIVSELEQALRMEAKLDGFQRRYDDALQHARIASAEVDQLHATSTIELASRLTTFNRVYTSMMSGVLSGCRTAKIDPETYLPVINDGEYREASADVSKRFLYYLTLLRISLEEDIPFPRFLLIDTPETAGIDLINLVNMIRQIGIATDGKSDYQILLSTGVGKYPSEYEGRVVLRLRDGSKLLQERAKGNDRSQSVTSKALRGETD